MHSRVAGKERPPRGRPFRCDANEVARYFLPSAFFGSALPLASAFGLGAFAFGLRRVDLCRGRHFAGRRLGRDRDVDFLGARQVDGDDRVIVAAGERDERDALGQLDVREVVDLIQLERR